MKFRKISFHKVQYYILELRKLVSSGTYSNICQHVFSWMLNEVERNQPRLDESTSHVVVHNELGYLFNCRFCSNHWNGIHEKFPIIRIFKSCGALFGKYLIYKVTNIYICLNKGTFLTAKIQCEIQVINLQGNTTDYFALWMLFRQ